MCASCRAARAAGSPAAWAALALVAMVVAGCGSTPARPRPANVTVVRDVPPLLRDTIGSQATFRGTEPVLVSGLGLVVGLPGTGGPPNDDAIMATMERVLNKMGAGRGGSGFDGTVFEGLSPSEILNRTDVTTVVVDAAIPPGLPEGSRFDLRVRTLPNSPATSLEGGRLWTTDLNLGPASTVRSVQPRLIAQGRGDIFVNPFAEPGRDTGGVSRTTGRVLGGGVVTEPLDIEVVLDNPSHGRARSIVSTLVSRFPESPDDEGPVARGRTDASVALRVPSKYRDDTLHFSRLIRSLTIGGEQFPQEYARRYADGLEREPALADDLSYCLEALGPPAVPFLRPLYEHGEIVTQLAALRAGARLGDAVSARYLIDLASSGPAAARPEAIELLADLDAGPTVDMALRDLLDDADLDVRVVAYESLARRAERAQFGRNIASGAHLQPGMAEVDALHLMRTASHLSFPAGTLQAVSRDFVGGRFFVDVVPAGEPLIYVTQNGWPRLVIFGEQVEIARPSFASIWSDRLMLKSDSPSDNPQMYYRAPDVNGAMGPVIVRSQTVDATVRGLVDFLGRRPTPEDPRPGLAFSYSETVGALAELISAGAIDAAFATERDRLTARLARAAAPIRPLDRPESDDAPDEVSTNPLDEAPINAPEAGPAAPSPEEPRTIVVPLRPRPKPAGQSG